MVRRSPPTAWSRRDVLAATGTALLAGCLSSPEEPEPSPTPAVAPSGVEVNVLVEHLEIPWDVSVAANGDLFVSERVGRIGRYTAGELASVLAPRDAIDAGSVPPGSDERPWWVAGGEGGTLGVAVHPDYPDVQEVFVYYTATLGEGKENRVSRFDVTADDPAATETRLVEGIPAHDVHNGGRLAFGPDGHLWVTTGTAAFDKDEASSRAADPASLAGKVLRVTTDGDPAPGNPTLDGGDPRVYTYGHRNPQGLAWLPDGTVLATEHGGGGHDEVNRLEPGADYGWPNPPRGREQYVGRDDVHRPLVNTGTGLGWAPSGAVYYTGDAVPEWRDRLLIAGLVSQQVVVAELTPPGETPPPVPDDGWRFDEDWFDDAFTVTARPVLRNVLGRVRHLAQGVDGELFAISSNRDGRAKAPFPSERDDVLVRLEVP